MGGITKTMKLCTKCLRIWKNAVKPQVVEKVETPVAVS